MEEAHPLENAHPNELRKSSQNTQSQFNHDKILLRW